MARLCAIGQRQFVAALLSGALLLAAVPREAPAADDPAPIDFAQQIAPLLVNNCVGCHSGSEPAGGFDLTSRAGLVSETKNGSAVVPGKPDDSLLIARVRQGEMPPPEKRPPLTQRDVGLLAEWVAAGAAWPAGRILRRNEFTTDGQAGLDWWSLRPLTRPAVPLVASQAEGTNAIDAFVSQRLAADGLALSPPADRRTLLRRATFDLLGLPPTPAEVDAFLSDTSVDAYERLIDRLLASPHYGERWGRHWLDVARFGETDGYETNKPRPNAWPYRDYVIRAFNTDVPYPTFILHQLAGDQVGEDAATGFLVGGTHDIVPIRNIEGQLLQRANDLDDIVSTTVSAFLGLSIGCARCHDHKADPITQRDYYALQAVFAGVLHGEREVRPKDYQERLRNEQQVRRELTAIEQRLVEADLAADETPSPPATLPSEPDLAVGGADYRSLVARRERLRAQLPTAGIMKVYAGNFEQPRPTHLLLRGDPMQPREAVAPGGICAVGGPLTLNASAPEHERRLALGRWLGDAANPLTARVLVNRLWHYHFGQGLVVTPNNFGFHGGKPSHPELLDWLAAEFIERGWSMKALHRQIMLSATYRQASTPHSRGLALDAKGRLLWRYTPRRLESEPIHDAMLAVSGCLETSVGGPSYDLFEANDGYLHLYVPKETFGPDEWRRMVYQLKPRIQQDATFDQFDSPDACQSAPRRNRSTTPMQALNLLNSPFVVDQSQHFAARLRNEAGDNPAAQITSAFRLALAREPEEEELAKAVALVETQGLAAFCRALFNTSEMIYVD